MIDLAAADRLLTTTRSVRKRLDYSRPVAPALIQECIDIAIQAPTGSNQQEWSFVVVTDAAKRKALAELYFRGFLIYAQLPRKEREAEDLRSRQMPRVAESAIHLAQTMEQAPVLLIPCIEGRPETQSVFDQATTYGSILPAVWSFMLAARSRGLGSAWTTIHLMFEAEAAAILDIPSDVTQVALLPVAYFLGDDFKPATRIAGREVTFWDSWGHMR